MTVPRGLRARWRTSLTPLLPALLLASCALEREELALVYRGPGGCPSCSEAVARVLRAADPPFEVLFVGPDDHSISGSLGSAVLYAQPGGDGTLRAAWNALSDDAIDIVDFVHGGGSYLGFCMGGYLAGFNPGFGLLPGDTDQYIVSPGADVHDQDDAIVRVNWGDQSRWLYFQDGPYFYLDEGADATIMATYAANGEIAALVASSGDGLVGVAGPHPEASSDWFEEAGLEDPDGLDADLALELVEALRTTGASKGR